MKILYITYIDFDGSGKSGSSVRPQKMYKAFLNLGLDVKLLECQQNKFKERRKKVREILEWLDNNTPDICYIESPSGPIFNQIDLKLINKVNKMGVPIAYFYRDAFWLFPEMYKEIRYIKKKIIFLMNRFQLPFLEKKCDVLFFPTKSTQCIFKKFNIHTAGVLPPASEVIQTCEVSKKGDRNIDEEEHTCIYVGGVSYFYGTDILLEAFKILNKQNNKYRLILACRVEDFQKFFTEFIEYPWLHVVHASGDALKKYYNQADVSIIPIKKSRYSNVAMSVKTFEYIGYGLPIIATNLTEMGEFVRKNKIGIVCEDRCV